MTSPLLDPPLLEDDDDDVVDDDDDVDDDDVEDVDDDDDDEDVVGLSLQPIAMLPPTRGNVTNNKTPPVRSEREFFRIRRPMMTSRNNATSLQFGSALRPRLVAMPVTPIHDSVKILRMTRRLNVSRAFV